MRSVQFEAVRRGVHLVWRIPIFRNVETLVEMQKLSILSAGT